MPASGTLVASLLRIGHVLRSQRLPGEEDILSGIYQLKVRGDKSPNETYGIKFAPAHGDAYSIS
jgi:hypothetical protein